MASVGEIRKGIEIGYPRLDSYIYVACPTCRQERWVPYIKGKALREYCKSCAHKGDRNWCWKGGKANHVGYIKVTKPDHHRADKDGYVLEHIVVWEQAHGKPLPKGWIIHHLNGIRNDNRVDNLIALPSHKHCQVLAAKAKRIQELEARLRQQGQLV